MAHFFRWHSPIIHRTRKEHHTHTVNRGASVGGSGHMPALSRVEGSVKTRWSVWSLAQARVFSSYHAAPLNMQAPLKVKAHFRRRRISLRLSHRDWRGSLLGNCRHESSVIGVLPSCRSTI